MDYKKRLDEQYQEVFHHKSKQGLTILTEQEATFIRAVMQLQPQGETSEQINKITN